MLQYQGCRGYGYPWIYPWIYPCVDIRLRLYTVDISMDIVQFTPLKCMAVKEVF